MTGQVKRKRSSEKISGASKSSSAKGEMKKIKRPRRCSSDDVELVATEVVDVDVKKDDVEANNEVTPNDDEDASEFTVEKICDKKVVDGVNYYYIKWLGYDSSDNTWEPEPHLSGCKGLLAKFEKELKKTEKLKKSSLQLSGKLIHLSYYTEWPKDKEPLSVEGSVKFQDTICYFVKFKTTPEQHNDQNNVSKYDAILATSSAIGRRFPQVLIKFFENLIEWADEADEDEGDDARVAVIMDEEEAPPRLQRQDQYPRDEKTG